MITISKDQKTIVYGTIHLNIAVIDNVKIINKTVQTNGEKTAEWRDSNVVNNN